MKKKILSIILPIIFLAAICAIIFFFYFHFSKNTGKNLTKTPVQQETAVQKNEEDQLKESQIEEADSEDLNSSSDFGNNVAGQTEYNKNLQDGNLETLMRQINSEIKSSKNE